MEIPKDYEGVMGVPISFMDKYNPAQFDVVGLSMKAGFGLKSNKTYFNVSAGDMSGDKPKP